LACGQPATPLAKQPMLARANTTGVYFPAQVVSPAGTRPCSSSSQSREVGQVDLKYVVLPKPQSPLASVEEAPLKQPYRQAPVRPQLKLPVPARCRSPGPDGMKWQMPGAEEGSPLPSMLPATVAVPPGLPVRKAPVGSRAARPVPPRLQQLDDQTTMPKEVYNRMLQVGDQARGALGYGQHRLVFTPGGTRILRRVVTPVSIIVK